MAVDAAIALLLSLLILCKLPPSNQTSLCTLDFKQFPFQARPECLSRGGHSGILSDVSGLSCCHSALEPLYQALAMRANVSLSIFLDPAQAAECSKMYQDLHHRTNLTSCRIEDFISSSATMGLCSSNVSSIVRFLGRERFGALRSDCGALMAKGFGDDACFNCLASYERSVEDLLQGKGGGNGNSESRSLCSGALLVTLASSNAASLSWIDGLFSCLWNEIEFQWPSNDTDKGRKSEGLSLSSKILLGTTLAVAFLLAALTPIVYRMTKKRLKKESRKEIEGLSATFMRMTLEDSLSTSQTTSSPFVFSPEEIAKAANGFDNSNLIGEGTLGKVYLGIMPGGQKFAVKRVKEELRHRSFSEMMSKVSKLRHPNLVTVLGYCDKEEQCYVCDYCINGNLADWLSGEDNGRALTWEQRLRVAGGIARGIWILHNNQLEKMIHGDLKLTNILLNENLEAKLSDYALADLKSGRSGGSADSETFAPQNDIFNFGIVLLQLLTGRGVLDRFNASELSSLVNEARNLVLQGRESSSLADPQLRGRYNLAAFQRLLLMAVLCTASRERERPNLEDLLLKLQEAQAYV